MQRTVAIIYLHYLLVPILNSWYQFIMSADSGLSHLVFFTLKDRSPEMVKKLLEECNKYLNNHPGLKYFAVGTLTPDLTRDVNDRDYDVNLVTVFENREAHDAYQVASRHLEFIERNRDNWKQVRVFDSDLV